MTTATKCIAVKTPFGNMYLELNDNGEYEHSELGCHSKEINHIGNTFIFTKEYLKEGWIECLLKEDGAFSGWLEISAHYGDQFPQ